MTCTFCQSALCDYMGDITGPTRELRAVARTFRVTSAFTGQTLVEETSVQKLTLTMGSHGHRLSSCSSILHYMKARDIIHYIPGVRHVLLQNGQRIEPFYPILASDGEWSAVFQLVLSPRGPGDALSISSSHPVRIYERICWRCVETVMQAHCLPAPTSYFQRLVPELHCKDCGLPVEGPPMVILPCGHASHLPCWLKRESLYFHRAACPECGHIAMQGRRWRHLTGIHVSALCGCASPRRGVHHASEIADTNRCRYSWIIRGWRCRQLCGRPAACRSAGAGRLPCIEMHA